MPGCRYQKSNKSSKSSKQPTSTTKEMKFSPQTHGKPQSATYATVKDALIQHVQKTYKDGQDIVKSLKTGTKVDVTADEPQ